MLFLVSSGLQLRLFLLTWGAGLYLGCCWGPPCPSRRSPVCPFRIGPILFPLEPPPLPPKLEEPQGLEFTPVPRNRFQEERSERSKGEKVPLFGSIYKTATPPTTGSTSLHSGPIVSPRALGFPCTCNRALGGERGERGVGTGWRLCAQAGVLVETWGWVCAPPGS